jgi:hypothetical protein
MMKASPTKPSTKVSSPAASSRSSAAGKAKKATPKSEISPRPSPKEPKHFFTEERADNAAPTAEDAVTESKAEPLERLSSLPTSQILADDASEVSSITQSTFEMSPPKKERSNSSGRKGQEDYHRSKFAPERDAVVVSSKGYTPKSKLSATAPAGKAESSSTPKSKSPSTSTTPSRSTSPRARPIPAPVLSPRDRARAQAKADEERRKALEDEYQRQLELERLEAIRQEEERLEAIRLEEER